MGSALQRGGLLCVGLAVVWVTLAAQAAGGDFIVPGSKAAGLKNCVEPTDLMRRDHMELIQHQRDATVHQGIRSTKHSLADCIACHVSQGADRKALRIDKEDQFCGACHAYAAVMLDCFQCHAATPVEPREGALAGVPDDLRALKQEVGQ